MSPSSNSQVHGFLDAYQAAFESFDPSATSGLLAYPCHITSNAGEIEVTAVLTREA